MSSHSLESIPASVRVTMYRDHPETEVPALMYESLTVELSCDPTASLHLDTEYWMAVWTGPGLPPGIEAKSEVVTVDIDRDIEVGPTGLMPGGSPFKFGMDFSEFDDTLELIMPRRQPAWPPSPPPMSDKEFEDFKRRFTEAGRGRALVVPDPPSTWPPVESATPEIGNGPTRNLPILRRPSLVASIEPPPALPDIRPVLDVKAVIEPPSLIAARDQDAPEISGGNT